MSDKCAHNDFLTGHCTVCGVPWREAFEQMRRELEEAKGEVLAVKECHDGDAQYITELRAKLEAVEKENATFRLYYSGNPADWPKLEAENAALIKEQQADLDKITLLKEEVEATKKACVCGRFGPYAGIADAPAYIQLQADLAASQKDYKFLLEAVNEAEILAEEHGRSEGERLSVSFKAIIGDLQSKLITSEASRGRLVEALEKMVEQEGICNDFAHDHENCIKVRAIAEAALSESPSSVYDAMKGAREVVKRISERSYIDPHTKLALMLVSPSMVEIAEQNYSDANEALTSLTAVLGPK